MVCTHKLFSEQKDEIKSWVTNSIVHVYGKVGNLEWQDSSDHFIYGDYNNKWQEIYKRKDAIDLMYPGRLSNNYLKQATDWLHNIGDVSAYAFGFNFDFMNYRILNLQNLAVTKRELHANIFPFGDDGFKNRRTMAARVRNMLPSSKLYYLSCTEFLEKVLQ